MAAYLKNIDTQTFEGTTDVCAHRISFSFWDFQSELNPELEDRLREEAESKAKNDLNLGCHSGELLCLNTDNDEEIGGWWEIE